MRLSVRRFQPGAVCSSFFGILDIKLGCELILLFGLIHKVAGVYGLITLLVGGSFVQIAFYAYSVASLFVFLWGLKQVKSELAHKSLLVAHLYLLDHLIQQLFHYAFFYNYWYIQKHDGQRDLNSQAQKDIFDLAASRHEIKPGDLEETESSKTVRAGLAKQIWEDEKGYAFGVIFIGFLLKLYCCLVLYSYAAHLRGNTYHSLPLTADAHAARDALVAARSANATPVDVDDVDEVALAEAEIAREQAQQAQLAGPPDVNGHRSPRPPSVSPVKNTSALPVPSSSPSASTRSPKPAAAAKIAAAKERRSDDSEDFSWD